LYVSEKNGSQLDRLVRLGVLQAPLKSQPPFSTSAGSLGERARAYLHVNCSSCHRPSGPGRGTLDLRFDASLADSGLCGESMLDQPARLIVPGNRQRSLLHQRVLRRDQGGMPPLASSLVDTTGERLLGRFIDALSRCP
jgi:hypothetical protein